MTSMILVIEDSAAQTIIRCPLYKTTKETA